MSGTLRRNTPIPPNMIHSLGCFGFLRTTGSRATRGACTGCHCTAAFGPPTPGTGCGIPASGTRPCSVPGWLFIVAPPLPKRSGSGPPPQRDGHDGEHGNDQRDHPRAPTPLRLPGGTRGSRQRKDLLVQLGARTGGLARGGRVRGRRGAAATRAGPGDPRSSRGSADSPRVRVLGRRAIHVFSIEVIRPQTASS